LAAQWPIQLEYLRWWQAGVLFGACAIPILWLGVRSLAGLGPVRKWVAIGARLGVLALLVLIIAGVRWTRQHRDLELLVVRDISASAKQFKNFVGTSFEETWKQYLKEMSDRKHKEGDQDRIGEIVFDESPMIDALPSTQLQTEAAAIRDPAMENQTDAAAALELALATFRPDTMRRLLLVWDGNQTLGNIEQVVSRAKSMQIPIDVVPLSYTINNEVLMERFVGPTWKRENEPFTIEVFIRSTNITEVTGKLEVKLDDQPLKLDPASNANHKVVTLKPGLNRFPVTVPGVSAGVKRFKATFEGQEVQGGIAGGPGGKIDTLSQNNVSEGFTVVQGKGKILYIDNARDDREGLGPGQLLAQAMAAEGINLEVKDVGGFPKDVVELQGYDAIVLHNVPYGLGGLDAEKDRMLAKYVHDMGGGLVMIGGKDSYGAGGWQGTKTEEILPVNMEIPAQRQMPKGALVLVMHSCEMPRGNYYGEMCAIAAVKALSDRDEIGVISFGFGGGGRGIGGSQWDFPLAEKGDGLKVEAAIKRMQLGDMPSFDDSLNLAINGTGPNAPALKNSDARQKHIIIISDGDPVAPQPNIYADLQKNKISVSTVTVYPHHIDPQSGVAPTMREIAEKTGGRYYGPIDSNPNQLPQIFIKEATVVRRSLIFEKDPLPVKFGRSSSDLVKGIEKFPNLRGMVLTSRKNSPQIEVPLVANENNDPVLAHWQAGLGKVVAFTSDATERWGAYWAGSGMYQKFWAQVIRSVARPPMSTDFDIRITTEGTKAKVVVEAINKEAGYLNFLNVRGLGVRPNLKTEDVRLVQTGPGLYETEIDAKDAGNYIFMLNYTGAGNQSGRIMGGFAQNVSPEMRDLSSNETLLTQIAERTGGRVISPFDNTVNLFSRAGLPTASSPLPVWDVLIPFLLALIIIDVAIRRIAWDWMATKRTATSAANWVRSFTTTRKVEQREAEQTLGALKQVRESVAEQKFKVPGEHGGQQGGGGAGASGGATSAPPARPNPKAKFEAREGVQGDISQVVGGATNKPVPSAPKGKVTPKGQQPEAGGNTMGGLMAAKKRAQEKIREREQDGSG
jgi:uncharacterized membrane protein